MPRKLLRYAAAIAIVLGTGIYFWQTNKPAAEQATPVIAQSAQPDILPGGNKAMLTLGDGRSIILDSAANGNLAAQGNAQVVKLKDGALSYSVINGVAPAGEVLYNKITTPRGGQYHITLPDGSKAWLNAASSLRFPTRFTGDTRTVEITGEAYFEVAKNKDFPFVVKVNDAAIKVLGTKFNIMAYSEEDLLKTTLLEGAVEFLNANASQMMKPGQQMQLSKDNHTQLISGVDTDEVIAWKDGSFHFEKANMEEVMRQLARWYDVEVVYKRQPAPNDLLYADIPRSNKLSDVLKALKIAGGVQIELKGKTIVVH